MAGLTELARRLPPLPKRLMAGFSGGADSLALLHLLVLAGCEITAVHVNHGLRGAESDGDEAFARARCAQMGIPLRCYRAHPPRNPGEGWAREARYGFFRQAAEETGVDAIALAHHQDDQAETLLLHLMRGAGLTGLAAMRNESMAGGLRILRPLLGFTRQELREALREAGLTWREDGSNTDERYLRNALRNRLLPAMESLAPGCAGRVARAASLLQQDEDVLCALTETFLQRWGGENCLPLGPLTAQPPGLQGRILRRWWQQRAGERPERSLSKSQSDGLTALVAGSAGDRCNLPGGWHGQRGWTHLHLVPPEEQPADVHGPLEAIPQDCRIRTRRAGDWLQLPAGRRSLKEYLIDRRVDAPFRDRLPLVCRENEVLHIAGVWPGELSLTWPAPMPWTQENKGE